MFSALLCFSLASTVLGQSPATRPAQIILIRHAEEPRDKLNPHLSNSGIERADRLVSFISTDTLLTRFGLPVAVFATRTTKDGYGQRTQETVAPLAQHLHLPVQTPFLSRQYAALAGLILRTPGYAGKTVLVCWTHSSLPQLAGALGVKPRPHNWKDTVYDQGYVITYAGKKAKLEKFRELFRTELGQTEVDRP
jgi:hypothetical protein